MKRMIIALLCVIASAPAGAGRTVSGGDGALDSISERLQLRRGANREAARRLAVRLGWPVRTVSSEGGVLELQGIVDGLPLYYATFNADAARTTRADTTAQLTGGGAGIAVGLWDADAARRTHQELAGRVTWMDTAPYAVGDHATHVAGTMVASGVVPQAKGMAPQASLLSWEWDDDLAEMAAAAAGGLLFSDHSYGPVRGWAYYGEWYWFGDTAISETEDSRFGFYDDLSRDVDDILHAAPDYLVVVSASNDRNDSVPPGTEHLYFDVRYDTWRSSVVTRDRDGAPDGYDCLTNGMQVAKNTMVVGAVEDVPAYTAPGDVGMTEFSSWGPTDDGRIKPDIVGNGFELYSCTANNDLSYGIYNGTSMAAPNVCGTLALLQDHYMDLNGGVPMHAATLKAVAVHTAREAGNAPGPDYAFGWGLLDAYAAYELIGADTLSSRGIIEELTLNDGFPIEFAYLCDGAADELRVTISWTDPPGAPAAPALDPPDPMLVNDLDLRVRGNGSTWEPWILDPAAPSEAATRGDNSRDNVEQIVIQSPAAGLYTVRIDHKGSLAGTAQDFSLIVTGAERTMTVTVRADGTGDVPDIASAIDAASDGWMIILHPGVYHEHDLVLDKQLVVKSVGSADETWIDAAGAGRCITIPASDDTIRIEDVSFRGGVALGGAGLGGGIYCANDNVRFVNCRVVGCTADLGGGVYVDGASPRLLNCRILRNSAEIAGGGVYLAGGNTSIDQCVIAGNLVKGDGGGIFFDAAQASVEYCTIGNNASLGSGGGVAVGAGSAVIVFSTIISHSPIGEGVYGYTSGDALFGCCDVFGNEEGNYGGTIPDQTGQSGNISEDPRFCNLHELDLRLGDDSPCQTGAGPCGGGQIGALGVGCHTRRFIEVRADGSGDFPTIQAALDAAAGGDTVMLHPGVYTGDGNRDLTFGGKGLLVTSKAGADSTVIDCESDGVFNYAGFVFEDGEDSTSVLEEVAVTRASKGGIRCLGGAGPLVRRCVLRGNVSFAGYRGGGAYVNSSSPVFVECRFDSNTTIASGGGVEVRTGEPRFERCVVSGNVAAESGGGINIRSNAVVRITDCTVTGNAASAQSGGGVCVTVASAVIDGCLFTGNSAAQSGGGIFNGISAAMQLSRTVVAGNSAANGGGGIYTSADLAMQQCTVAGNSSSFYGSGVECQYGDRNQLSESIVAFNGTAGGIYTISGDIDISCSDVFGNEGGDYAGGTSDMTGVSGNISQDSRFCAPDSSDYRLYNVSPCLPAQSPCGMQIGACSSGCIDTLVTGAPSEGGAPAVTRLRSIHPNPFNPATTVRFDLASRVHVRIAVFDVTGRRVATLVDGDLGPGRHTAVWRGRTHRDSDAASGIYFLRFEAGGESETRKIVLLR